MYQPEKYYYIVSIDIGVKHLGISLSAVNKDYTLNEIIWIDVIDITTFVHLDDQAKKECTLYHDKTFTDYLEHVFYLHTNLFKIADWILIERQPIQGFVVVEQLIFSKYRSKTILISPNSVHAWIGFNKLGLDYDGRKVHSVSYMKKYLSDYYIDILNNFSRAHDIADTICILQYWLNKKNIEYKKEQYQLKLDKEIEHAKKNGLFHSHLYIEKFRYIV